MTLFIHPIGVEGPCLPLMHQKNSDISKKAWFLRCQGPSPYTSHPIKCFHMYFPKLPTPSSHPCATPLLSSPTNPSHSIRCHFKFVFCHLCSPIFLRCSTLYNLPAKYRASAASSHSISSKQKVIHNTYWLIISLMIKMNKSMPKTAKSWETKSTGDAKPFMDMKAGICDPSYSYHLPDLHFDLYAWYLRRKGTFQVVESGLYHLVPPHNVPYPLVCRLAHSWLHQSEELHCIITQRENSRSHAIIDPKYPLVPKIFQP